MRTMKRFLIGGLMMMAATMTMSCSFGGNGELNGNLKYSQEDLRPKAFKEIDISTVANVYYTQNDGDKCDVRLDFSDIKNEDELKALKEKLKVVYRDGGVEIGLIGKVPFNGGSKEGSRLKVYITSPDLVKVTMEGVGSFHADKINSDVIEFVNEGVGSMNIKNVLANTIKVDNEGVGSVTLGKAEGDELNVDNEGVGSVNVNFFKGGSLVIDNEGVGSVTAKVDCKSVKAELEGVGGVTISGNTQFYKKQKGGIGKFNDSKLNAAKVLKVKDDD